MGCHRGALADGRPGRPGLEVADVFRAHGETYRQSHALSDDQLKAMRAIERCRTEALGGHLDVCPACGYEKPAYNSCRNRHCPKCQSLAQARWIDKRLQRILPTQYFHVVFTLPADLRPLARANRKLIFDLLFAAASQTLITLGDDPDRLGGRLGLTAVLHTWTRELTFHPHLHCIVTGGGLSPSGTSWVHCKRKFLFPVLVLGKLFRGKFLDGLRRARTDGSLRYTGGARDLADDAIFKLLLDKLYATPWVVYAKRPFAGPEHVFRYLGRYTHRVAISNQRIQAVDTNGVRFVTKGAKTITIDPQKFIRRFLDHILPAGFTKIRHFGLHASANVSTKLQRARDAIAATDSEHRGAEPPSESQHGRITTVHKTWQELLRELTGVDPTICPECRHTLLREPLRRSARPLEDSS